MLHHNRGSKVDGIFGVHWVKERSLPTSLAKVVQFLVENISGQHNGYSQLMDAQKLLFIYKIDNVEGDLNWGDVSTSQPFLENSVLRLSCRDKASPFPALLIKAGCLACFVCTLQFALTLRRQSSTKLYVLLWKMLAKSVFFGSKLLFSSRFNAPGTYERKKQSTFRYHPRIFE